MFEVIDWTPQCFVFVFPCNPAAVPLCIFVTTVERRTLFSCQIMPRKKMRKQRQTEKERCMQEGEKVCAYVCIGLHVGFQFDLFWVHGGFHIKVEMPVL